jgi:thiol-disulfide isomerase/thioredoxin
VRVAVLVLLLYSIAPARPQESDPYRPSTHPVLPHHEEMVGQLAPDLTFVAKDGKETSLSAYRGRPVLIDVWATWCAPCLAALPSLRRIYAEFKGKGMEMISFDEDGEDGEDGDEATAAAYLARHHYEWKNFHDTDRKVAKALECDGLPLVVLIDSKGTIVYFGFGGKKVEAYLREAIAGLGPEFAPPGPSNKAKPVESQDSADQN